MKRLLLLLILSLALLTGCATVSGTPNEGSIESGAEEPNPAGGTQPTGTGGDWNDTPGNSEAPVLDGQNTDPDTPVSNGITVNLIDFSGIDPDSTLSQEIKEQIQQNQEQRGYQYFLNNGEYTLVIYAGQKPSAGHLIEVVSVKDSEGKTVVVVEEKKPTGFAAEVITYPFTIVTFSGTTDQFEVVTKDKETLKPITE